MYLMCVERDSERTTTCDLAPLPYLLQLLWFIHFSCSCFSCCLCLYLCQLCQTSRVDYTYT